MQITFLLQLLWDDCFYTFFKFNHHNNFTKSSSYIREKKLKYKEVYPLKILQLLSWLFKLTSLTVKPIPYLPYHIVSPKSQSVYFST